MPIGTPFHPRTKELCTSLRYKDWAGYFCVCSYDTYPEREYFALRHAVGLIDVSPLFKYEVRGKDATALLSRVMTKNIAKLKHHQVTYCCWCDDDGMVVDDGTVTRLDEDIYRVTAAEPTLAWLARFGRGLDVTLEDSTDALGALAVQGPFSRALLCDVADGDVEALKFFRHMSASIAGIPVDMTRTGYTGDLGYEVWVPRNSAVKVYDAILEAGARYGAQPAGMDAMDITRIEAGFIMNGVEYFSAHHCFNRVRQSSPYELGLSWTVNLNRAPFNGQVALAREKQEGSRWALAGISYDWDEIEAHYADFGLPPQICQAAWRDGRPVYDEEGRQIGKATSGTWSPTLKQYIALASLEPAYAKAGTRVKAELTVEYERRTVTAVTTSPMFFNPERKRS